MPATKCCVPYNQKIVLNFGALAVLTEQPQNSPTDLRMPQTQCLNTEIDNKPPSSVPDDFKTTIEISNDLMDPVTYDRIVGAQNDMCIIVFSLVIFMFGVWFFIIYKKIY